MFTHTNHILVPGLMTDALYIIGMTIAIISGLMVSDEMLAQAGVQLSPQTE